MYDLNVYSGKDTNQVIGTLGERVVTKLCASVRNPHVLLSFDRFFTSVNLMQSLQFPAVGTVIKNRKNVPKFTAKLKRVESEFRVSEHGVMAARWMDSNDVIALSIAISLSTMSCREGKNMEKRLQSTVLMSF